MVSTPPSIEETFSRELKGESVGRTTTIPRPSMQTGRELSLSGGYRDRRTLTIPEVQEQYPGVPKSVSIGLSGISPVPAAPSAALTAAIANLHTVINGFAGAAGPAVNAAFDAVWLALSGQDNAVGTVINDILGELQTSG